MKMNKKGWLGSLVGGFVVLLIGISLIKPISEQVALATHSSNFLNTTIGNVTVNSSANSQLLSAVPYLFAIGILGIAIVVVFNALKSARVLGAGKEDEDEEMEDGNVTDFYTKDDKGFITGHRENINEDGSKKKKTFIPTKTEYKSVYSENTTKFDDER